MDKTKPKEMAANMEVALTDMFTKKCLAKITDPVTAFGARCLYVTDYEGLTKIHQHTIMIITVSLCENNINIKPTSTT